VKIAVVRNGAGMAAAVAFIIVSPDANVVLDGSPIVQTTGAVEFSALRAGFGNE
jgi:hypothetical protein